MAKPAETPLMKQYAEMKRKHPDAVLLFRVGDFYETFSSDAITASEILGITLTRRANGKASHVELAGFPHHALDTYLPKLVRAGKRVAICEQLEDPKLTKKLVKRDITELVTPGVNINDSLLDRRENNFVAALHYGHKNLGVAFLDISTGEYMAAEGDDKEIDKLLAQIGPKELLIMRGQRQRTSEMLSGKYFLFELEDWIFTSEAATERLLQHFGTKNLKGFGLAHLQEAIVAAGALLHYLDITKHPNIAHITRLSRLDEQKYVHMDMFTIRNLELIRPMAEGGTSLTDILDSTLTPMGARLLRRWILFPLRDQAAIESRQSVVEYLFRHPDVSAALAEQLRSVGDLERLVSKTATGRVTPRELVQLKNALLALPPVKERAARSSCTELRQIASDIDPLPDLATRIQQTLREDAPSLTSKGGYIASVFNPALDELRSLHSGAKQYLQDLQRREGERTGITSLKVGFNNVFGYYIEVRNTHRDKVPADWIRKQTLTQAERYITPELKEYEEKILGAEEKILSLELKIFTDLIAEVARHITAMQADASALARIDVLLSFSAVAQANRYVRPKINSSLAIDITQGRHPVIEHRLPPGEPYVPNSLQIDSERNQILMITGPNMSGKSALLRQTALITLMAQTGCFVPAQEASIGIVDKIFTRVGASDNISQGESTFMVEMNEAASIINNMSPRSLILFDELGRGTSTYDGISIAWAIVEHLHQNPQAHPRTLFATHYHELNEMERLLERVANFHVSVEESQGRVVFSRRLQPGGSEHSFGIHVARLAGMPPAIVRRADAILHTLEQQAPGAPQNTDNPAAQKPDTSTLDPSAASDAMQLSFFQLDDPVLCQVRDQLLTLDINNLTPLQALSTLNNLKEILNGK